MKETVQLIFLGHWEHIDRVRFLLRKFIPHKVYFIRGEESAGAGKDVQDFISRMKQEIEKELPQWVREKSEEVEMSFFSFERIFPKMLSIMAEEKKKGNEVIANLHGSSLMMAFAATIAAGLTHSKAYWIIPEKWETYKKGEDFILKPTGIKELTEINIPLLPTLPSGPEKNILEYILKHDSKIKGKLSKLSEEIGLKNLGANLKKPSSGIVKLSKTIGKLRGANLIETRKIGRKNFEISLTDKGKMMAEIITILEESQ